MKQKQKVEEELISLQEEKTYREGTVAIRDLIAPSAFRVESNFIQLGEVFLRTIFVITYPRYISVGWSTPILNLNITMDISMFFYPVTSAIILKQLKNKVGALEAQISADAEKGAPRDPIRETALRDIEQLRDDLTQGIEHFFQFAFYVTIYAKNMEELERTTEDIENILKLNRNVEIYLRGRIINGESVKLLQEAKPILDGIYWDISQFVQIVTQLTIGAKGNVFKGAPPDKFPAINLLKQLRIDIKVIGKAANNIEVARKPNMKASDMI